MDDQQLTKLHKEIDLIQACITRMAECSFKLKEWYISLLAVVLTLLVGQDVELIIIGLFLIAITSVFWGLDSFYLITERRYRWKFAWVIDARTKGDERFLYDMNPIRAETWKDINKPKGYFGVLFSKTIIPLYLPFWIAGMAIIIFC